ncbi:hypothetical protein N7495_002217 [Penicillium taxi]|uniref:uncharacterized protein n=1 Tax=Penicillium taxi TaxID=168475 RepID=UPI002544E3FA|nr:uncharacterized protein N7495_002217 [Penicillium taxi]KAJ5901689.1 hypothetical protein N7495_002217 [Penicillium taxi]
MPYLRRHNPREHVVEGQSTNSIRAQFQTPPTRHTPSNPTRNHPPPSTEPHEITPEVPAMAPPGLNPFSIFGRQRRQAPPTPSVEFEEDNYGDEVSEQPTERVEDDEPDLTGQFDDAGEVNEEGDFEDYESNEEADEDFDDELLESDEDMPDRDSPRPHLREISSLASWTLSSNKPDCGVAALRSPDHSLYWQSDGPQPHYLTLHFAKLVAVVHLRVYLDFTVDESYTPTKMVFVAGMGGNDLVEFATWEGEGACGWVDISLDGVGGRGGGWVKDKAARRRLGTQDSDDEDGDGWETTYENDDRDDKRDPYAGNVLKAMVIQMRVLENHQNGKDTHVRGFQVYAFDENHRPARDRSVTAAATPLRHEMRDGRPDPWAIPRRSENPHAVNPSGTAPVITEPDWMGEPIIR